MPITLVPNLEPASKFVEYFVRSVGQPFDPTAKYVPVEGGIIVVDPTPKPDPKAKIQPISEPEAARQQAEEVLKEETSTLTVEDVNRLKRKRKAQTSSGPQGSNTKRRRIGNATAIKINDVFTA